MSDYNCVKMKKFTWIYFTVLCGSVILRADGTFTPCNKEEYKKIGCFSEHTENKKNLKLLLSFRDGKGEQLDWDTFPESIHSLLCRCNAAAKAKRYPYFTIRFWAECYGGHDLSSFVKVMRNSTYKSDACVNGQFEECRKSDTECVGRGHTEYAYMADCSGIPSACSKTCGGGTSVHTECTVGKDYLERIHAEGICNKQRCPPSRPTLGPVSNVKWSKWSECSKPCGGGNRRRWAFCKSEEGGMRKRRPIRSVAREKRSQRICIDGKMWDYDYSCNIQKCT